MVRLRRPAVSRRLGRSRPRRRRHREKTGRKIDPEAGGGAFAPWTRPIRKPVVGTVQVGVAGTAAAQGAVWTVDCTPGLVTFGTGQVPAPGAVLTAGFLSNVPVRLHTDHCEFDMTSVDYGQYPTIPLEEILA